MELIEEDFIALNKLVKNTSEYDRLEYYGLTTEESRAIDSVFNAPKVKWFRKKK